MLVEGECVPVQMNIAEAKAKLSELVARALDGEEVVIARDGIPVVILAPVRTTKRRVLGRYAHLGPLRDPDALMRPDPDIEALQDDPIDPQ